MDEALKVNVQAVIGRTLKISEGASVKHIPLSSVMQVTSNLKPYITPHM
jgi:hypothetical protein